MSNLIIPHRAMAFDVAAGATPLSPLTVDLGALTLEGVIAVEAA
jgi:hypothetical protein